MATVFSCSVKAFAVWAAEHDSLEEWCAWAKAPYPFSVDSAPKVQSLDPMLRRRCSKLSRMSLEVADRCLSEKNRNTVATVFGSRSGESQTTMVLLEQLAKAEMVSPMKFGLSVHNTTAGLFGIAFENRTASTAIAAGEETFAYSYLEAVQQLQRSEKDVLLIMSEEKLPPQFINDQNDREAPFALALLLGKPGQGLKLELEMTAERRTASNTVLPQGLRFIEWLFSNDESLWFSGPTIGWNFRKNPEENWLSILQMGQVDEPLPSRAGQK